MPLFCIRYLKSQQHDALTGYVSWVFALLPCDLLFVVVFFILHKTRHLETNQHLVDFDLMIGSMIVPIICVDTILNKYLLFNKYLSSFIRAIVQSSSFPYLSSCWSCTQLSPSRCVMDFLSRLLQCYLILAKKFPLPSGTANYQDKEHGLPMVHFTISLLITPSRSVIYFFVQYLWSGHQAKVNCRWDFGLSGAITTITFAYHLYTKAIETYLKPLITRP